jgi:hypothetical protein
MARAELELLRFDGSSEICVKSSGLWD